MQPEKAHAWLQALSSLRLHVLPHLSRPGLTVLAAMDLSPRFAPTFGPCGPAPFAPVPQPEIPPVLVDTAAQMHAVIWALLQTEQVAVDVEGPDLSREGSISLLQVCTRVHPPPPPLPVLADKTHVQTTDRKRVTSTMCIWMEFSPRY